MWGHAVFVKKKKRITYFSIDVNCISQEIVIHTKLPRLLKFSIGQNLHLDNEVQKESFPILQNLPGWEKIKAQL